MSFGNRGLNQGSRAAGHRPVPVPKTAESGLGVGFLSVVVVVFFLSFCGFWVFNYMTGKETDTRNPAVMAMFAGEPIARARSYAFGGPVPFAVPTENTLRIAVQRTETGMDAIDSELHEHCTRKISNTAAVWAEKKGTAIFDIEEGAAFLACSMKHQVSRFCKPVYRERLAGRIKDYLQAYRKNAEMVERFSKNRMGQQTLAVQQMIDDQENGGIVAGRRTAQIIPGDLGRELRKLSGMGLIGERDFSTLLDPAPAVLVPYLSNVSSPC